jgi:hypothetical protein
MEKDCGICVSVWPASAVNAVSTPPVVEEQVFTYICPSLEN